MFKEDIYRKYILLNQDNQEGEGGDDEDDGLESIEKSI